MVAKLVTLPRTLLVAGVLAMAPAAFAFAQTPTPTATPTPTTAGVTTPANPAVKPVAKTETGTKKVKSAKQTPVKAETKTDGKTPAVPPKS